MSNIVNLNRFRKQKNRAADKKHAAENSVKFGRTRSEKKEDAKARDDLARHVDGHQSEED